MISFKPLKLAYIRDHFNQEIELSIISEIVLELNYPYGIIRKSDKKQNCEMRAKFYKEWWLLLTLPVKETVTSTYEYIDI